MNDIYHITRERVVDIYDTRSNWNQLTDLKSSWVFILYKISKVLLSQKVGLFFILEFKVIENLKPNKGFTNILKDFKYKVKLGQIKNILHTNLQVVIPTEYQITYPTTLTILEYKVNEISNKPFYIKEHNQKYNIKEITQFWKKF